MAVASLTPKVDRRRVPRDPDFELRKVADGSRGELFVILVKGVGTFAESSRPLSESASRNALHKLGYPAACIQSMLDQARTGSQPPTSETFNGDAVTTPIK